MPSELQKLRNAGDDRATWRSILRPVFPFERHVLQVLVEHQLPDVRLALELEIVLPQ